MEAFIFLSNSKCLNFRHVVEINVKDDPPYYYVKTSETFMLGILLMVPILSLRIQELIA